MLVLFPRAPRFVTEAIITFNMIDLSHIIGTFTSQPP